jgi:hypothetical protein
MLDSKQFGCVFTDNLTLTTDTGSFEQGKFYGQAARPISTGKLHALPRFHIQPITWWSSRGLQHPRGWGYLILGWVSRLYAFSVYPIRT